MIKNSPSGMAESFLLKTEKSKGPQNRERLLFHGLIRLWLRNSRLRLSDSLATTANFISRNYAIGPDVLLLPLLFNLFPSKKPSAILQADGFYLF
ncbi:hypothetical protein [Succiniclasticum ruminis]|uniref:hypothetical protein n=1 Tax=Succiniclasticum ruminis TaxID=40841 RepID=UPI000B819E6B|nr:hypothetical protein [Succiniclasticum ruminis]